MATLPLQMQRQRSAERSGFPDQRSLAVLSSRFVDACRAWADAPKEPFDNTAIAKAPPELVFSGDGTEAFQPGPWAMIRPPP